ncbi:MAG: flagellar basal body rod protein FlgB [Thioalkalispiraceae bacterium]|jgi:flagellar basal-body rod protein FlgB
MPISFDNILGVHQSALHLQARRAEVLASNLANADTPGYKARDFDFKAALDQVSQSNGGQPLHATSSKHMQPDGFFHGAELKYRQPLQDSLDGNTVEPHIEIAQYTENSVRYMASLQFVGKKLSGLITALKGE